MNLNSGHSQSLTKFSESILFCINFVVFSTSFDCRRTNNGVACISIKCSISDSGFAGVCSSEDFGHNSCGNSLILH